ncbi:GTP-binding protein alpha subunit gna protein [Fasciolopsis buskii]|uniref:GTP-binding protein alpha subunit gna protein n=1 Tax=Fasciolopsis buskii TaxID=27845 RepID=A0A8E0VFR9_9TREM|nr:GTP-binding protein alpha subunit gna protein [Fasciolopsis buski]
MSFESRGRRTALALVFFRHVRFGTFLSRILSLLRAMSDSLRMLTCCAVPSTSHTSAELLRWQRKRNREIERDLRKEKNKLRRRQMILLLGTGESGKSTFLKQMKIINGKRFSPKELELLKDIIYDNIYKGVLFLLQVSLYLLSSFVCFDVLFLL